MTPKQFAAQFSQVKVLDIGETDVWRDAMLAPEELKRLEMAAIEFVGRCLGSLYRRLERLEIDDLDKWEPDEVE